MAKTILITGATDGIGLETARLLATQGHDLLLHGRNAEKLSATAGKLETLPQAGSISTYQADFSTLSASAALADDVLAKASQLDVLINNAGVFTVQDGRTKDDLDLRFAVNTFAPYILARRFAALLGPQGRIVNLSSAAQARLEEGALEGKRLLSDNAAYAQSKLAITMWTRHLADRWGKAGPMLVAVNPGSLLGSKMVKQAYGLAGKELSIGANILVRAALSDEFANAGGCYFDNDSGSFADPHPHALDSNRNAQLVAVMEQVLAENGISLPR